MNKIMDLCTPCAELMRNAYDVSNIAASVNRKITCAHCKRRRYGATYEVTPKKRKGAKATLVGLVDAELDSGMTPEDVAKKLGLKEDTEGSF